MRASTLASALAAGLLFSLPAFAGPAKQPLTAQEVIARMVAANGAPPIPDTVDTIKAGDPATPVTGIATTFMDTMAVLREAVAHGDNLIVTHEPTFYNHRDDLHALPADDPVVAEKLRYIQDHHLVVWRFHDGWHRRQPDGILTGVAQELGLAKDQQGGPDSRLFALPQPIPLRVFAGQLEQRTGAAAVRVVGNPDLPVTKIAVLPGSAGLEKQVAMLERPDVEVLIVGEATEWETIPYAADAAAQGRKKALILLGHSASEEAGMKTCADWLRGVFPGMRVDFLPAHEAFSYVATQAAAR